MDCPASSSVNAFVSFSCELEVEAGTVMQIAVDSVAAGEIRNARISFDLVDVNKPAVVLMD
jgi:hypothetical protein